MVSVAGIVIWALVNSLLLHMRNNFRNYYLNFGTIVAVIYYAYIMLTQLHNYEFTLLRTKSNDDIALTIYLHTYIHRIIRPSDTSVKTTKSSHRFLIDSSVFSRNGLKKMPKVFETFLLVPLARSRVS